VVTIKEIAQKAQLSIGTVDRVLHGRGRVSKKTEEKIKALIKKTGYKTNIHARNLSLQTTLHLGVIMPFPYQGGNYWDMLRKGIDRAATELSSFNVNRHYFFFDKYSEVSFANAGRQALEQHMGGLIIAPVLLDVSHAFVKSIPDDVPYVYVDSTVPGTSPLAAIGQNSFQSGVCAAKLMRILVGEKGSVAVLRILPNAFYSNERVRGFSSFFEKIQNITVRVFDLNSGSDDREFVDCVTSIKTEVPDCKGLFMTNAETYRLVKALRAVNIIGMRVIGYDCIDENMKLVQEGAIDFIISQNTQQQGYMGINTLFRHLVLKEPCLNDVRMPIDIVMAENLSDYQ
jgi:LacI family transcriptional regulator